MEKLMSLVAQLSRYSLRFGGALVLLAALLIGVDVILRKFFQSSIGGADELAGYALALGTSWSLGATLLDRAHIRIDSLYSLFPRRFRPFLDFIGLFLFLSFFGLVAWRGLSVMEQSWVSSSRSHTALATPLIIPQTIWIIGFFILIFLGVILFTRAVLLIWRGDIIAASRTISTRAAAEEVEEEVRFLKEHKSKKMES